MKTRPKPIATLKRKRKSRTQKSIRKRVQLQQGKSQMREGHRRRSQSVQWSTTLPMWRSRDSTTDGYRRTW